MVSTPTVTLKRVVATLLLFPAVWSAIGVVAAVIVTLFSPANDFGTQQNVARTLKISEALRSMHNLLCSSTAITDVIAYCTVDIDPNDFPGLLTGRLFALAGSTGRSDQILGPVGESLGPTFDIAVSYEAQPPKFAHWGRVRVGANAQRTRVMVNLFEE